MSWLPRHEEVKLLLNQPEGGNTMDTLKDTTENTATPRGSGGGLQSKSLPDTADPRGSGGPLQSKAYSNSNAAAAGAQQQPEVERGPEQSEQTTTPEN